MTYHSGIVAGAACSARATVVVLTCLICALLGPLTAHGQRSTRDGVILARLPDVKPPKVATVERTTGRAVPGEGLGRESGATLSCPLPVPHGMEDVPVADEGAVEPRTVFGDAGPATRTHVGTLETLGDAWRVALEVDQARMAGRQRIGAALRGRDAALANRYPLADLTGRYTVRDNEPSYRFRTPLLPHAFRTPYLQSEDFAFEGRVELPLYTGGGVSNQIAAARSHVDVARRQLDRYQLDLKMSVAEDYVAVLRAEQEVLLAESHLRSLARHMEDIEMFYRQERAPLNDLLSAQVACSNARYRVAEASSELDSARASYNRHLDRPLTAPVSLSNLCVSGREYDVEQLTQTALANRAELAELDARIAAHRHQAEVARAENRAQVSVEGAYTFRENRYQSPEGITSAGIGAAWNLFDGGRAESQAEKELQQAQALAHRKADLQGRIRLDVRRSWLALQETRQRLKATHRAIDRSEENLRVTRQRYNNGMATNTEVLAAETLRVQTYHNHNTAVFDGVLAELALRHATATFAAVAGPVE